MQCRKPNIGFHRCIGVRSRGNVRQSGFTIVELLIVIVVIGILAAISIVAHNGVQARAVDAQQLSSARTELDSLASYLALNGSYQRR